MRKTKFIVLLLIIIISKGFSNDTMFKIAASGIAPLDENKSPINLTSEILYIELFDDNYSVKVDYTFFNSGLAIETEIGFPIKIDIHNLELKEIDKYITNFKTSVNDKYVDFRQVIKNYTKEKYMYADLEHIEYWYIKEVNFGENSETRVSVEYTSRYNGKMGYYSADYYYGSGYSWKKGIENFSVIIKPHGQYINKINIPFYKESLVKWADANTMRFTVKDVKPKVSDTIRIDFCSLGMLEIEDYFNDDKNATSWLSLKYLSKEQLRFLRNGFYAFFNYKFSSQELLQLFSKEFYKYKPLYKNVDNKFGDYQKKHIQDIIAEEETR